jgi:BolA protein
MSAGRVQAIQARLSKSLRPRELEIRDDGHLHQGHVGHGGGGHFHVRIVADAFIGKRLTECHRMVYAALDDLMGTEIHALAIDAKPTQAAHITDATL